MSLFNRKGGQEEHIREGWLIPYSDLLTLLLALFIVLFSISNVDKERFQSIMEVFYSEFSRSMPEDGTQGTTGEYPFPNITYPPATAPAPAPGQNGNGLMEPERQAMDLFGSISNYIETNNLSTEMKLHLDGELILLTLTSDVWFASGSADISAQQREMAHKLGNLIAANQDPDSPLNIIVTGHTDNRPINTARYQSNWHLSASRAVNFMGAMFTGSDLDPRFFSARGYGEYDPIDTNDTEQGRRHNRRVEVLISFKSEVLADLEQGNNWATQD